ncbi:MAG TPA: 4-alpha-glucanotransferase, partial [Ilumatobacteraceae bacterium]|nr:4-alpha-glucanotransferase [Ilumatobacteraceae bacterium]
VLDDGTTAALVVDGGHVALPRDLPIGCHRVAIDGGSVTVVVPPAAMPRAPGLAGGASLFVPTYALWERAAPLPSFAHLTALAIAAHRLGIDVVATLPLYAAFLDEPFDPSPYAPVSRLHWNELYLDDATLPSADVPAQHGLIDWRELAARRRRQLLDAARDLDPYIQAGIDRFVVGRPDVVDFARFGVEHPTLSDAGAPAALVERSHLLAQYLADRQLAAVEGEGRAALALDLPIGSHVAGYETWAHGDLFAPGMTVGAPPDEFFADGQDWGFPPQLPGAGRRDGHSLWRRLVGHAGRHASVLRIDHVMGVHRLWWVPEGMGATEGAYVRYPREELLAVIAAEATRAATTIVGENLGTVPDELSTALEQWDVVGLYEEQFSLYHRARLPDIPARSVAGMRTHDMPAFAAAFSGDATGEVHEYRRLLAEAVGHPVGDDAADVFDAALERLAASDAYLVVADLDDLLGETAPHNVPGKVLPSTWRRRLPRPLSEVLGDREVRRRVKLLANRPAGGTP